MSNVKVNKFLRAGFILRLAMRLGWRKAQELTAYRLCSQCFSDEGLRLSAEEIGLLDNSACPNCHAMNGQKLTKRSDQSARTSLFRVGDTPTNEIRGCTVGAVQGSP